MCEVSAGIHCHASALLGGVRRGSRPRARIRRAFGWWRLRSRCRPRRSCARGRRRRRRGRVGDGRPGWHGGRGRCANWRRSRCRWEGWQGRRRCECRALCLAAAAGAGPDGAATQLRQRHSCRGCCHRCCVRRECRAHLRCSRGRNGAAPATYGSRRDGCATARRAHVDSSLRGRFCGRGFRSPAADKAHLIGEPASQQGCAAEEHPFVHPMGIARIATTLRGKRVSAGDSLGPRLSSAGAASPSRQQRRYRSHRPRGGADAGACGRPFHRDDRRTSRT